MKYVPDRNSGPARCGASGLFLKGIAGLWFIIWRGKQKSNSFLQKLPEKSCLKDYVVGFLGGLAGGFVGINSPIFILYFGSRLAKGPLRRLLVLILLPLAVSNVAIYNALGLMSTRIILYSLVSLPGLLLGVYVGNPSDRLVVVFLRD